MVKSVNPETPPVIWEKVKLFDHAPVFQRPAPKESASPPVKEKK